MFSRTPPKLLPSDFYSQPDWDAITAPTPVFTSVAAHVVSLDQSAKVELEALLEKWWSDKTLTCGVRELKPREAFRYTLEIRVGDQEVRQEIETPDIDSLLDAIELIQPEAVSAEG